MGTHSQTPVAVDPESLKQAQSIWHNFMQMTKYGVIATIILLIGMAIFLV